VKSYIIIADKTIGRSTPGTKPCLLRCRLNKIRVMFQANVRKNISSQGRG